MKKTDYGENLIIELNRIKREASYNINNKLLAIKSEKENLLEKYRKISENIIDKNTYKLTIIRI